MTTPGESWLAAIAQFGLSAKDRRRSGQRAARDRKVRSETPEARAARLARRRSSVAERECQRRWKVVNREHLAAYLRTWLELNAQRLRACQQRKAALEAARLNKPARLSSGPAGATAMPAPGRKRRPLGVAPLADV